MKKLIAIAATFLCLGALPARAQTDAAGARSTPSCSGSPKFSARCTICARSAAPTRGRSGATQMEALVEAEAPSGERRRQIVANFNRGYRGFQQTYRTCTPAADIAIRRYLDEGAKISREITARYATEPRRINLFFTCSLWLRPSRVNVCAVSDVAPTTGATGRDNDQPWTCASTRASRCPTTSRSAWRSAICRRPGRKRASTASTAIAWRRPACSPRFAEFVTTYGEDAAAKFAEGLGARIRNGEFSLDPPRQ